jgi:urease accessory protein
MPIEERQIPTGHLRLRAERIGGRTVLSEVERSTPFSVGAPSYRSATGRAEVIVQDVGPGRLPGDALLMEIVVGAGADLGVRGQAATKIYPSPGGEAARCRTVLRVAAGGRLVYLPGELIPFRDAVYEAETEVEIAAAGRFALLEVLTPGRAAMGERLAYRRLDLRLRVRREGRLVLAERARLEPRVRALARPAGHGPFACTGALVVVGPASEAGLPRIEPAGMDRDGRVLVGLGGRDGVGVARAVGVTAQEVRTALEAVLVWFWPGTAGERGLPGEAG